MKSFTLDLLLSFVSYYEELIVGARLNEVGIYKENLWLFFHKKEKGSFYFYICMNPNSPIPIVLKKPSFPFPKQKKAKPIQLFLKTHALGAKVSHFFVEEKLGRILSLKLQDPNKTCSLEIRLFPHGQNIIVQSEDKKISLNKVLANPLFCT